MKHQDNAHHVSELVALIKTLSYEKRLIKLVSGRQSDFYVDMKNTLLHPRGIWLVGQLILSRIKHQNEFGGAKIRGIGGLTMGADPISTSVSLLSQNLTYPLFAFYIRKEQKGHGTAQWLEGMKNFKPGDKVVILEDVVTTGGSTMKSVTRARMGGLDVCGIITVVDRQEGGAENITAQSIPFSSLVTREMIIS